MQTLGTNDRTSTSTLVRTRPTSTVHFDVNPSELFEATSLFTKSFSLLLPLFVSFLLFFFIKVDAVRDPEGAQAEAGIPGALTAAPEPQWESDATRVLELLGLRGQR